MFKAGNGGGTPPPGAAAATPNGIIQFKYYSALHKGTDDPYPQQYESCTKTYNHFNIILPPTSESPKWSLSLSLSLSLHFSYSN
jgi:hypothetical protein